MSWLFTNAEQPDVPLSCEAVAEIPRVLAWGAVCHWRSATPPTWTVQVVAWMLLWVVSRTTQRLCDFVSGCHHLNSLGSSPRAVQSVAEHQPALLFHEWSSPFMQPWVIAWGRESLSLWVVTCLSTHIGLSLLTLFCVALSAQCQYNVFIWLTHYHWILTNDMLIFCVICLCVVTCMSLTSEFLYVSGHHL